MPSWISKWNPFASISIQLISLRAKTRRNHIRSACKVRSNDMALMWVSRSNRFCCSARLTRSSARLKPARGLINDILIHPACLLMCCTKGRSARNSSRLGCYILVQIWQLPWFAVPSNMIDSWMGRLRCVWFLCLNGYLNVILNKRQEVNVLPLLFEEQPPSNRSPLHQMYIFRLVQYRHAKERDFREEKKH